MYTKPKLGEELKAVLTIEPYDPYKIAKWAENIHFSYCLELSKEVYDIVETLAIMCMGPEFQYTKKELLILVNLLINNEDNATEKFRKLIT